MSKKTVRFIIAGIICLDVVLVSVFVKDYIPTKREKEVVTITQEVKEQVVENTSDVYEIDEETEYLLAKMVFFESSVCSDECQQAIASVAINQWLAGYWGDSLANIVTNQNIYSTAYLVKDTRTAPNQRAIDNVRQVIHNGVTIDSSIRYFRLDHDFSWDGYEGVFHLDNVYFGHFTNGNH